MSDNSKCPVSGSSSSGGVCPVGGGKNQKMESGHADDAVCPMKGDKTGAPSTGKGCPVSPKNVYKWFTGYDLGDTNRPVVEYKNPQQFNVSTYIILLCL